MSAPAEVGDGREEERDLHGPGVLVLCGTPIGNLHDMSERAVRTLAAADILACEEPDHTRKLLTYFGLRLPELVTYNEGNELRRTEELVQRIEGGARVVLVSNAGMPLISDPGYRLVVGCITAGLRVEVVPGPSAAIAALAVSGLPSDRFSFEGFLPRKSRERRRRIAELAGDERTILLYESPRRIGATLEELAEELGPRPAALAREITKVHEEVRRGSLASLLASVEASPPRGELVLVVGGAARQRNADVPAEELAARARSLMSAGVPRSDALRQVALERGVPRRAVFDALLERPEG
jgi:16S rRNA (cytidine1402-2'-O)-methyltransferase